MDCEYDNVFNEDSTNLLYLNRELFILKYILYKKLHSINKELRSMLGSGVNYNKKNISVHYSA